MGGRGKKFRSDKSWKTAQRTRVVINGDYHSLLIRFKKLERGEETELPLLAEGEERIVPAASRFGVWGY